MTRRAVIHREQPDRRIVFWSPADEARLRQAWEATPPQQSANAFWRRVAKLLPERTPPAIEFRARQLGLAARTSREPEPWELPTLAMPAVAPAAPARGDVRQLPAGDWQLDARPLRPGDAVELLLPGAVWQAVRVDCLPECIAVVLELGGEWEERRAREPHGGHGGPSVAFALPAGARLRWPLQSYR